MLKIRPIKKKWHDMVLYILKLKNTVIGDNHLINPGLQLKTRKKVS